MAAPNPAVTPPHHPGAAPGGDGPEVGPDAPAGVTIALHGRLDALRALPLRTEFDELVAGAAAQASGAVLVDLTEVDFVDSAALAALVRLRRQCATAGLDLKFVKPRHQDALRIFRLTQFDEVFVMLDPEPAHDG